MINTSKIPPILFLVFNRPIETGFTFDAIRSARPEKLYISCDGPRVGSNNDSAMIEEVKRIVSIIDWPCIVHTRYSEINLGCKVSVSTAISWFFNCEEFGIILEDDCLASESFFTYCADLLEKYKNDDRIGAICGTNLYNLNSIKISQKTKTASYYYSNAGASIWGWATWKRVWIEYDVNISSWDQLRSEKAFQLNFSKTKWNLLLRTFNSVYNNKIDTWDFQFSYLLLTSFRLSIIPSVNLVKNIGFNDRGTHTKNLRALEGHNKIEHLEFPLKHPTSIYPDAYRDSVINSIYSSKVRRIINIVLNKIFKISI